MDLGRPSTALTPFSLSPSIAADTDLVQTIRSLVEASVCPNTRRTYHSQFAKFAAWCAQRLVAALPADPSVVAAYLADLASTGADPRQAPRRFKVATVVLALSAITAAHRDASVPFDPSAPPIRAVVKGIRRAYAEPQAQAAPLRADMVRDILDNLGETVLERRDAALVALLYSAALRCSELVGLDFDHVGSGDGTLAIGIKAIEITLLRSKARSEPTLVRVPCAENPGLVDALLRWIASADISPGAPLIRSVGKGGQILGRLSTDGVARIVKRRVQLHLVATGWARDAAIAEARLYSAHSGRVGACVSAAEAGVPIHDIAAHARHRSLTVAVSYARKADLVRRAPSKNPALAI